MINKQTLIRSGRDSMSRELQMEAKVLDLERQWKDYANVERQVDAKIIELLTLARNEAEGERIAFQQGNVTNQLAHAKHFEELIKQVEYLYNKETADIKAEIARMKFELNIKTKQRADDKRSEANSKNMERIR